MASPLPCTCVCDSTDSPLSTTANVTSIVTLVYIVLASILYQLRAIVGGIRLLSAIGEDAGSLRELVDSLTALTAWNEQRQDRSNKSLQTLLIRANNQLREAEDILSHSRGTIYMRSTRKAWMSFKFLRTRVNLEKKLSAVKGDIEFYAAAQYVLFLPIVIVVGINISCLRFLGKCMDDRTEPQASANASLSQRNNITHTAYASAQETEMSVGNDGASPNDVTTSSIPLGLLRTSSRRLDEES
jgi:hypothetical protein